jgi:predicted CoA-binding protein
MLRPCYQLQFALVENAMNDTATIYRILRDSRRIAVVGLSARWYRPSYFAAKYLQGIGYEIIPVNPTYDEVLGVKAYPDIQSVPGHIDVVDIFQRPERVPPIVDAAIEIGADVIWMQLGVVHEEAAKKARAAGLDVIMDRCMKIEHGRLLGGLGYCGVDTGVITSKRLPPSLEPGQ